MGRLGKKTTEKEYVQAILERFDTLIKIVNQPITSTRATPESCPLFYEYVEKWLNEVKAPKIKPKSLSILRNAFKLYIKPAIKDKLLNKVRTPEIAQSNRKLPV